MTLELEKLPMRVQIGMAVGSLVDMLFMSPVGYLFCSVVWLLHRSGCEPLGHAILTA